MIASSSQAEAACRTRSRGTYHQSRLRRGQDKERGRRRGKRFRHRRPGQWSPRRRVTGGDHCGTFMRRNFEFPTRGTQKPEPPRSKSPRHAAAFPANDLIGRNFGLVALRNRSGRPVPSPRRASPPRSKPSSIKAVLEKTGPLCRKAGSAEQFILRVPKHFPKPLMLHGFFLAIALLTATGMLATPVAAWPRTAAACKMRSCLLRTGKTPRIGVAKVAINSGGCAMANETKGKQNEKLAAEIVDPTRRVIFLREKIEAVRDGLIRTHNKAFPTAGLKYSPAVDRHQSGDRRSQRIDGSERPRGSHCDQAARLARTTLPGRLRLAAHAASPLPDSWL